MNETGDYRIWVDDNSTFSTSKLCALRHNYGRHPLLQLDALERLAQSLIRTEQCRFITPGSTVTSALNLGRQDPNGRSIQDIFRRIEDAGSWVALYNIESDPAYRQFLWDVLHSAGSLVDPGEGVFEVRGFIFISAPPSVTPFHIDRENNFWLQVKGRKSMSVWDRNDRDVVSAKDVETFIIWRSLDNVSLTEVARQRSFDFNSGPGDGVYFPSTSPHMTQCDTTWVEPGNGVSISIGINFYTSETRRHANVHAFNGILRNMGINPRPPGQSAWLDRLKYPLGRAVVSFRRRVQGREPPPGF